MGQDTVYISGGMVGSRSYYRPVATSVGNRELWMQQSPIGRPPDAANAEHETVLAMARPCAGLVRERMALDPGSAEALRTEAPDCIRIGDDATEQNLLWKHLGETEAYATPILTAA